MSIYDIRLIAIDLDGTLLIKNQIIAPEDADAIRAAQNRGICVALCSGRISDNMSEIARRYDLGDVPILSLNGGYCVDMPFGVCYSEGYIREDALESCLSVLAGRDLTYGMFQRNCVYSIAKRGEEESADRYWGVLRSPGRECISHGLDAYRAAEDGRINKIVVVEDDESVLNDIRKRLSPISGLCVSSSGMNNIELMPSDVDKGTAVRALAESLGLSSSQVMAIGDFDTDESMIAYAGLGVAMGNASESVKQASQFITETNERCGVAKAILRFAVAN